MLDAIGEGVHLSLAVWTGHLIDVTQLRLTTGSGQWMMMKRLSARHTLGLCTDVLLSFSSIMLTRVYRSETFGALPDAAIFTQNLWAYIPSEWLHIISSYTPGMDFTLARHTEKIATGVAKELVEIKTRELLQGERNRDIMSLLGALLDHSRPGRRHR